MSKLFKAILVLVFSVAAYSSDIKTQSEADAFLDRYRVSLNNEVAKAVARQEAHVEKGEWQKFAEQGGYIAGLADTYDKLCKD